MMKLSPALLKGCSIFPVARQAVCGLQFVEEPSIVPFLLLSGVSYLNLIFTVKKSNTALAEKLLHCKAHHLVLKVWDDPLNQQQHKIPPNYAIITVGETSLRLILG